MGTKKVNKSRRALMNGSLGLGALGAIAPTSWTKPLVNSVILPVHAQTSPIYSFSIEKTQSGGPSPAMSDGDVIEYTILVINTGTEPLTNVVATDTMPDGTVVVLSGQTESLTNNGILDVDEMWTYETSYTVSQDDIDAGAALVNSVEVGVAEVPMTQVDDAVTPVTADGSFAVEKTQSGGANPVMLVGDEIEYTIVVTNTGGISLTGVVATDTMPDGSIVILSDPAESLSANNVLEVGEAWTYLTSYTATADDVRAGVDLINTVSVVTNEVPDPQTDDEETPVVAVVCPEIVIGGVVIGPGSGPEACTLSFDIFSADAATPLEITNITNSELSLGATVEYDFPLIVTDSMGSRVSWTGMIATPECNDFSVSNVVFTVTATCEGAVDPFTTDFNLSDIAAMA